MLYVSAKHGDPSVLPVLVNRKLRRRKFRVRERAQGNGDQVGPTINLIGHGGTAVRAETVGRVMAAISPADPSFGLAGQRYVCVGPARLSRERASSAFLAIKAVAD